MTSQARNRRRAPIAWRRRARAVAAGALAAVSVLAAPTLAQEDAGAADDQTTALPTPQTVSFDVFRREGFLGVHSITFDQDGDTFTAVSDIELKVRVGPITFFYYKHDSTETWVDGAFSTLTAETRKDRKDLFVDAAVDASGVLVNATEQQGHVDGAVLPTTWWNEDALQRDALLNAEVGTVLPLEITAIEETTYEVQGVTVPATRYRVAGTLDLDLFYDDAGRWIGCEFIARGAIVRYVMTTPYPGAA